MDFETAMQALESAGTAQNRKIFPRHGVGENVFGVSFADLGKFTKQIKKDTPLALRLWQTGNHDARMLATMIANPLEMDKSTLQSWADDLDNYVITDSFSKLASQSRFAEAFMLEWIDSESEWVGRAGWRLIAYFAMVDQALPDDFFEPYIARIEKEIHTRLNYVRDEMNSVLIAIGIRNPGLQAKALTAAARIGKVSVDHGQTNCKTPDAAGYILKTWARKIEKQQKG